MKLPHSKTRTPENHIQRQRSLYTTLTEDMACNIKIPRPTSSDEGDCGSAKIEGFEVVASYNWLDEPIPTILVPGIPPIWNQPLQPQTIKRDSGQRYVNQNADRTPGSPLKPLILAVQTMQPDFDFSNIDIMTDRKPIRDLLGFVQGETTSFKFGITILDNAALLNRLDDTTRDMCPGFRAGFEKEFLQISAAAQGSTSHHRIVTYEFGGMRFLVRYAVAAYLHGRAEALMRTDGIQIARLGPLVDWALSRGLSAAAPSSTLPYTTPVTVITGGHNIPHASTLELVTRAKHSKYPFRIQSKLASLWISQTQNLVTAFYHNAHTGRSKPYIARYDDVKVEDVKILVNEWEGANQSTLQKLVTCLKNVIKVAKELKGPCIVHYEGTGAGSLKISSGEVPSLPREMQRLFHQSGDMEVQHASRGYQDPEFCKEVIDHEHAIMAEPNALMEDKVLNEGE